MPPSETPASTRATPRMSPTWLALWAGADKALPMLYGVAVILIAVKALDKAEWGAWTVFSAIFMVISLLGDFFVLQPMVKLASEEASDPHPTITSALVLYSLFSLLLGGGVALFAGPLSALLKTDVAVASFQMMGWVVLTNLIRTHAIRVLQVSYRIVAIFAVDLVYFGGLVGLMIVGHADGTLDTSLDLVNYNLIAFGASSILGLVLAFTDMIPRFHDIGGATRRLLRLGLHQGGTGILTVMQQQSDVLIVSAIRGVREAGIYGAARTFYRFFDSVRDAAQLLLVPATSRAYSQERIEAVEEVTELATAALVVLMFPLTVAMIIAAPLVFGIVLPNFPEAVEEFQWLMANGFAMPFIIVPSAVLLGIGHTRDLFRGTLIGTIVLVVTGSILTYVWGSVGMAAGVLAGSSVTAVLLTQRMNRYVPFTFRTVLRRSRSFGPILRRRLAAFRFPRGRG